MHLALCRYSFSAQERAQSKDLVIGGLEGIGRTTATSTPTKTLTIRRMGFSGHILAGQSSKRHFVQVRLTAKTYRRIASCNGNMSTTRRWLRSSATSFRPSYRAFCSTIGSVAFAFQEHFASLSHITSVVLLAFKLPPVF